MFEKILIANRGEIAVRIIRTCKEMNIRTVAVYSEADANSMHVQLADEAICIGKAPVSDSYLRIDRIISAAEITDVDAIHPGYGLLSENAHFADVCENCNIKFIGPNSDAMNALEDKAVSRRLAQKAGVPTPPGSEGTVDNREDALDIARKIGYPVLIKAVAGGGGCGMRVAHNDISLINSFHAAKTEAEKAFGNAGVYIEKFIELSHHVEFQILADTRGNVIHLGERDCSIQRRNQKLIEETPSPLIDTRFKDLRKKMSKAAIAIAKAANYNNAGTVEFIVSEKGEFYFLEMNKRIQVEHPITEEVTGVDIVKEQISIAAGNPLSIKGDIQPEGHAIECRINAEDPANNFRPCPGTIQMLYTPGGRNVRFDSHIYAGYTIPPYYDSMLGKLIVWGKNRSDAIERMARALSETMITNIKTTIGFQQTILNNQQFRRGNYATNFIEKLLQDSENK